MSSAYLFRRINAEDGLPTILYDEVDALFGGKSQTAEEIRALLNAGHRRGAMVGRCVVHGKTVKTGGVACILRRRIGGARLLAGHANEPQRHHPHETASPERTGRAVPT